MKKISSGKLFLSSLTKRRAGRLSIWITANGSDCNHFENLGQLKKQKVQIKSMKRDDVVNIIVDHTGEARTRCSEWLKKHHSNKPQYFNLKEIIQKLSNSDCDLRRSNQ